MKANGIKRLWAEGRPVVNGWLSIGCAYTAEIMAGIGYDSLTIDQQHGLIDDRALVGMLQALDAQRGPAGEGPTPLVRVPWLEPGAIMKALDAGAYGIVCPMVNSRKDAEQLVSYLRYPPRGTRSFGPARPGCAVIDYAARANDEILGFAMIETAQAVARLEEIVTTPGLDGVYVGPADLTLGLSEGRLPPGFDREEPEMIGAIRQIADAAKAAGIRAGLHCASPDYAARALAWGYDLVTLGNDVGLLRSAASGQLGQMREKLGTPERQASV